MRAVLLLALAGSLSAQSLPGDRLITSEGAVGAVSFLADGTLAGLCSDGVIRMWDVRSGKLQRTLPGDKSDSSVRLPGKGDVAGAVGSDGTMKLWDLRSGESLRKIAGPAQKLRHLEIAADRTLVAGGGHSSSTGSEETVRLWDSAGRQRFAVAAGIGGTSAMAISPDGGTVVAASYDTNVRAWSTRNGELLRLIEELPVTMFDLAFSPDGKYLASAGADRTVYLWDAKTWKLARKFTGQPEMISALAFSPDSRLLMAGGFSEFGVRLPVKILLWDVAQGKVLRSLPSSQMVASVAFSPDGALAATANRDKTVSLWAIPGK